MLINELKTNSGKKTSTPQDRKDKLAGAIVAATSAVSGKASARVGATVAPATGRIAGGVGAAVSGTNASSARAAGSSGSGSSAALSDTQRAEAALVARLPADFPFEQWDSMPTKAQFLTMQNSGLNAQEQWQLHNASTPLEVLALVNTAQSRVKSGTLTDREANDLTDRSLRYAAARYQLTSGNASSLPPLQKGLFGQQLLHEIETIRSIANEKNATPIQFSILGKSRKLDRLQYDGSDESNPNDLNIEMFNLGNSNPYKLKKGEYYFVEETAVLGPLLVGHTVIFDEGKYAEYKYIGISAGKSIVPADHLWVKGCVNNIYQVQDYEGPFLNMAGGIGPFGVSASLGYNIDKDAAIISGSNVAQQLFAGLSMSYLDYTCINQDWIYGTAPISWGDTAYDHALGSNLHREEA